MPLTLHVDKTTVQNPAAEDIATGFASIDAERPGSISVIELQRPPFTLCAFGHPKMGYTLDLREAIRPKDTETSKVTSIKKPISHDDVIHIFQDFARGDDSWQGKFEWEPGIGMIPTTRAVKWLAVLIVFFILIFLVLKYVLRTG